MLFSTEGNEATPTKRVLQKIAEVSRASRSDVVAGVVDLGNGVQGNWIRDFERQQMSGLKPDPQKPNQSRSVGRALCPTALKSSVWCSMTALCFSAFSCEKRPCWFRFPLFPSVKIRMRWEGNGSG